MNALSVVKLRRVPFWLAALVFVLFGGVLGMTLGGVPGITPGALADESRVHASDHVRAKLVSDANGVSPGQTFMIALHQDMDPHWHTYWRNPGDSGEPTDIQWTVSDGVSVGALVWPTPEAISVAGVLTNYGYEDEVLLMAPVTVGDDVAVGSTVTITADVLWLECADICIPVEDVVLTLELPVLAGSGTPDPVWGPQLDRALALAPQPVDFAAGVERIGDQVVLSVGDRALVGTPLRGVHFFPYAGDVIDHNAPQGVVFGDEGLAVGLAPVGQWRDGVTPVDGVLAFERRTSAGWVPVAVEISVATQPVDIGRADFTPILGGADGEPLPVDVSGDGGGVAIGSGAEPIPLGSELASGAVSAAATAPLSVFWVLVFGFLGGLILNLMPCVFPVLTIKAVGFVAKAHDAAGEIRRHGLMFLAGVLSSFGALAIALIGVKAAIGGEAIYGAWLQSPGMVLALAVVVFLIGLNLLGAFELGGSVQNLGAGLASRSGDVGAFFTGVLAVVVGAPCTGPLMAGALGAVFGMPAGVILVFFLLMGAGLAAPFVALSFAPGLLRLLPKPGAWMNTFKQALAFPMFLTGVWLVWTVSIQLGANGAGLAMLAMIAAGFGVWMLTSFGGASGVGRWIGRAGGLAGALLVAVLVVNAEAAPRAGVGVVTGLGEDGVERAAWSPEAQAEYRAQGRMVFIDFTAAWCAACQANKLTTLNNQQVLAAFREYDVVFMTADWTSEDSVIAEELSRYGRQGVPLYVLIKSDGETEILPQLLKPRLVIDAVVAAGDS